MTTTDKYESIALTMDTTYLLADDAIPSTYENRDRNPYYMILIF